MAGLNMGSAARQTLDHKMSEAEWMQQVRDYAELRKWLVYHTHDSRRSDAGFPDLVMVRGGVIVFAELKTEKGRVSEQQTRWCHELRRADALAYTWRPSEWPDVKRVLQ